VDCGSGAAAAGRAAGGRRGREPGWTARHRPSSPVRDSRADAISFADRAARLRRGTRRSPRGTPPTTMNLLGSGARNPVPVLPAGKCVRTPGPQFRFTRPAGDASTRNPGTLKCTTSPAIAQSDRDGHVGGPYPYSESGRVASVTFRPASVPSPMAASRASGTSPADGRPGPRTGQPLPGLDQGCPRFLQWH
jgi:hypothetical protein